MLSCAVGPGNPGRCQPIPGNEPPQVSARAAGGGFDGEAGGPDRPLRVAVRPAATCDPGPCRLDQVLQSSAPRALGPDVLEHPERPPGTERAPNLAEARIRIVDAAEDEAAHHRVEGRAPEWQRLGAGLDQPGGGGATARAAERAGRGIDPHRAGREERQVSAGAAAEVEDAPASALTEPSPPAPQASPLGDREGRVVEPGDLIDATHWRSGVTCRAVLRDSALGALDVTVRAGRAERDVPAACRQYIRKPPSTVTA
jgi:hypothetical protein